VRSEKEQAILIRMDRDSEEFVEWAGKSIHHWIDIAYRLRFDDVSEAQMEFIEGLHKRGPSLLRRRQMRQLIRVLELVDATPRSTGPDEAPKP
jgi:hypothetical protein